MNTKQRLQPAKVLERNFEVLYNERSWKRSYKGKELDLAAPENNALFVMN